MVKAPVISHNYNSISVSTTGICPARFTFNSEGAHGSFKIWILLKSESNTYIYGTIFLMSVNINIILKKIIMYIQQRNKS